MNASEFLYKKGKCFQLGAKKQGFLLKAQKSRFTQLVTTSRQHVTMWKVREIKIVQNHPSAGQSVFSQSKVYCENIAAGPLLRVRSCGFMASGEMRAGARVEGRGKK